MSTILVTGGAGFIGSHTCVVLLEAGHDLVVLDNLSNSSEESLARVGSLAGRDFVFQKTDLLDLAAVERVFETHTIDAVIHFAGLKAVGESVENPLWYWRNNCAGTLNLVEVMRGAGVRDLVFSSSSTVYGVPESLPVTEAHPLGPVSPYGKTKLAVEEMLHDVAGSEPGWRIALLRYFNPVGAHASGEIGEDPTGIPNNLMPFVMQVAVGRRGHVAVFGHDYDTPDGTGVRDYIHVMDLAEGHLAALERLDAFAGCEAVNLGTGEGYSVLDVVKAAGRAVGREIPYELVERRPGDVAAVWSDPGLARAKLGWQALRGLDEMCRDSWCFQSRNPTGFARA